MWFAFSSIVLKIVWLCQSFLHPTSYKSLGEDGKGAETPFELNQGVFLPSWEGRKGSDVPLTYSTEKA